MASSSLNSTTHPAELFWLYLALDQAGAYLEETGSGLLEYFQIYQEHRGDLLKERRGLVTDHPESVATTWSLSFAQVEQKNPAASDLLRLCAFLDPDAIPLEIITQGAAFLGPRLGSVAGNIYLLNQAIEALRAYSLVGRDSEARTLSLHRLVQAVVRDALSAKERKQWMQRAVSAVNTTFPYVEFAQWMACERCLPHALVCATWIEQEHMIFPKAARLLNQTAYYLTERAQYAKAEPLYQHALSINEQLLGTEHLDTALSLNNLADLYRVQGKYAEPLYRRALTIREQKLGVDHPDTAQSLNNLAVLYQNQGKYAEAEPLFWRALSINERRLGAEHPDMASSLNNLAELYRAQGKYAEAEPLYRRALSIRELQLGDEHPGTAQSLNNLALLYQNQRKYAEAEPLFWRALSINEQQLGAEHLDTALSLNNLAELYRAQGKYTKAEPLHRRALSIRELQLEADHPDTALSLNNLAVLYQNQRKYAEAEPLYRRALSIREPVLGPEHPDTAQSVWGLASLYQQQQQYQKAEPLYQRALSIYERMFGSEHPHTQIIRMNYARLLGTLGRNDDSPVIETNHEPP